MTVQLCVEDGDRSQPCRFAKICHEPRQRLHASMGLRGKECWFFVRQVGEAAYDPPPSDGTIERAALQEGEA